MSYHQPLYQAEYTEIPILKSQVVRKDNKKPAQVFMDITFQVNSTNSTANLDSLHFQNYYSSSLTISQLNPTTKEHEVILEKYKLMEDAFSEEDSQAWFSVSAKLFNSNYVKFRPLRITLFQPASIWEQFDLKHVKALSRVIMKPSPHVVDPSRFNLTRLISSDLIALSTAYKQQLNVRDYPDSSVVISDYKRSSKKKEKGRSKEKRSTTSHAVSAIPNSSTMDRVPEILPDATALSIADQSNMSRPPPSGSQPNGDILDSL